MTVPNGGESVNAPAPADEHIDKGQAKFHALSQAIFDGHIDRLGLQILVLIGEAEPFCYYTRETFAKVIFARAIPTPPKKGREQTKIEPVTDRAIENALSKLKTRGHTVAPKRPVPQANNRRLTTYQYAVLADKIEHTRSAQLLSFERKNSCPGVRNDSQTSRPGVKNTGESSRHGVKIMAGRDPYSPSEKERPRPRSGPNGPTGSAAKSLRSTKSSVDIASTTYALRDRFIDLPANIADELDQRIKASTSLDEQMAIFDRYKALYAGGAA